MMSVRNIEDLNLDEVTEEMLLEECIALGEALGVDTSQGSIYRDACDGHIIRTAKFFEDLRQVGQIISLDTCTGDFLEEKLRERALEFNPPADTAASYYVTFVGNIPELGAVMMCDEHFFTLGRSEDGERYIITSEETGTEMNTLAPGLPVIPEEDVDDMISAVLGELAVPALDRESDDSARIRLHNRIAGSDENGNIAQVQSWCESVEGVGRARIIPLWNGPNTVKGIIISRDGGVPSKEVVDAVQEYVDPGANGMGEGKATIGQVFTAEAAQQVPISVSVSVIKSDSASLEAIQSEIGKVLKDYCKEIALGQNHAAELRYNRISAAIMDMEEIIDHADLLVNGGTKNITFEKNQIPAAGEVSVSGDIL